MGQVRETIGRLIGPEACFRTCGVPKRRFMAEMVDTYLDVWIDDAQESVVETRTRSRVRVKLRPRPVPPL